MFAQGNTIYAATINGLSISTDGGTTFVTKTTTDGLGHNVVNSVFAQANLVYAATNGGLSISTDGGNTFTQNYTQANNLGDDQALSVYARGNTIYVATPGGLGISTNGGATWITYRTTDGLGNNQINSVFATANRMFAATNGGLSFCPAFCDVTISASNGLNLIRGQSTTLTASREGGAPADSYVWSTAATSASITVNSAGTYSVTAITGSCSSTASVTVELFDPVADGPACDTYITKTVANGLGSNQVYHVYAQGNTVYAIANGLNISTDNGKSFVTKTTANGLGSNYASSVFADGSNVYVGTDAGLGISTDGGNTFTTRTAAANGLADDNIASVFAVGNTIYANTGGGDLSISTDGGASFTTRLEPAGQGGKNAVFALGSVIYVATLGDGLKISTDGGLTWITKTTTDGLASNALNAVYAEGNKVYVGSYSGLSISTDGGNTFTSVSSINQTVYGVYARGNTIYAATSSGLQISTNGGTSWTTYTTTNGLGDNAIFDVFATADRVYVGNYGGLSFCPFCEVNIASSNGLNITRGNSATLTASGANNYVWSTSETTASVVVSPTATTTYSVTGTSAGGCSPTASITLTVFDPVADGPTCGTYVTKTTVNGLGNNQVNGVYADGNTVYAATRNGMSISTDGGNTFINKNLESKIYSVYAVGGTVYAGSSGGGLFMSTNGGVSYTQKNTNQGLGANSVSGVYVVGNTVYAATDGGLSISTDGGNSFVNKTTANGLGANYTYSVYAQGNTIYVGTDKGLSISYDGGNSFINKSAADGLGADSPGVRYVIGVYAQGSTIYGAMDGGLAISTDGGAHWTTKSVNGSTLTGVYARGNAIYASTTLGLQISTNGGNNWTAYTNANGLGDTYTNGVFATTDKVYAATNGGVSFCGSTPVCSLTVSIASVPSLTITQGQSASLTASGATSYTWSSGETTASISATAAGTYSVTGVTGTCSATASVVLSTTAASCFASLTPSVTSACVGSVLSLTATNVLPVANNLPSTPKPAGQARVADVAGVASYTWTAPAGVTLSNPANTSVVSATLTSSGVKTFTVAITNEAGCTSTATVSVTANALPTVSVAAAPSLTITGGQSATLTASGANSYTWSTSETTAAISVSPTTATTYSVTGVSTSGCSSTTSVTVIVRNCQTTLASSVPQACVGNSVSLTALNQTVLPTPPPAPGIDGSGNIPGPTISYVWVAPAGATLSSPANTSVVSASFTTSGVKTFTVTVTNQYSCVSTATISVTANALPTVNVAATPSLTITGGQSATLTASGANSYTWSTSETTAAISVSPTTATTYSVTGVTTSGCSSSTSVTVIVQNCQTTLASSAPQACVGNSVSLTALTQAVLAAPPASPGVDTPAIPPTISYVWAAPAGVTLSSPANTSVVSASFTTSGVKTFTVTVTNQYSCVSTATISVTANAIPVVSVAAAPSLTITGGQSTTLTASGANSYTWSTSETTASISVSPTTATTYSVTGVSTSGCSSTTSVTVIVRNCQTTLASSVPQACVGNSVSLTALTQAVLAAPPASPGVDGSGNIPGPTISYVWAAPAGATLSSPANTSVVSASFTTSGVKTFTVTVTNQYSCVSTATVSVTANSLPTPTLSALPSTTITGGVATTLVATGGTSYAFSGTGLLGQNTSAGTATANQAGVYSVTVTNTNGCSATTSLTLTLPIPLFTSCGSPTATIGQPLQIIAPVYNCATGLLEFRTLGGDGSPMLYGAIGVTSPTTSCTHTLDSEVAQDIRDGRPNVTPFTLVVEQSGQRLTYTWDALAACASQPPVVNRAPIAPVITNQVAQTGTAFSLTVPVFADPDGDALAYSVLGLPANGLSFDPSTRIISGTPSTTGVMSLTAVATDPGNLSATVAFSISVVAPISATLNVAPVAPSIANQVATVGQAFVFGVPAFTDPNGDALAYSATGLPANGLSFDPATRQITGTPSTTGTVSISVKATDPGNLSATATFSILVSASVVSGGPLTLLQPTYNCQTGAFTFRSSGGNGGSVEYMAIGITGWTTNPGPFTVLPASDAGPFTLLARQNGAQVSLSFDWKAFCATITPPVRNQPPVATPIANQTATVGQFFSMTIPAFTDPNGDALAYALTQDPSSGLIFTLSTRVLSGTPSSTGVVGITVVATDPGSLSASSSFSITVLPASVTTVNPPTSGPLVMIAPIYDCSTGAITFRTTGGDGTPIEYFAIGITGWNSNPNQQVEAGLRADPSPVTLHARQSGVEVTYVFDLKGACSSPVANRAPVVSSVIASQTATVGQPYNFPIPAGTFTDPDGQALVLTASGLPAGLSFSSATLSGTPSVTGTSTITVVATDPGSLSVSTTFTLTVIPASVTVVIPPTGGPLVLIAPIYDCSTGAITFQTTGGDGSTIEYFAIGITAWSTNPVHQIEPGLRKDPSPITLHARQNGVEVTYAFDLPNACNTPAVNHAPVVSNTISSQTATVGQGYSFVIPANTFTDPDGQTITLTASGLPAGLSFSGTTITGTPSATGVSTITVIATDPGSLSVSTSFTLTVIPASVTVVNQAPVVSNVIPSQTATVGQGYSFAIPAGTFTDPENQALTLTASGLPAGLSFSGSNITGTPSATGVSTITVVATDPGSLSVSTSFILTVVPVSVTVVTPPTGGPLTLIAPIYDCSTGAITFQTTGGDGSTIEYFAIGITSWSTNPNQVIENGLRKDPSAVTLHARQSGVEVTYVFDLPNACNTPAVNHAPVVSNTIPSQTATVGQGYSFAIPTGTFTDPDNQALTLTASGLPAGLSFSGTTITGTPSATGVSSVTVVATDPGSLSVSTSFTLTILPASVTVVNQAPVVNNAIPSQTATVGQGYSFAIPAGTFTDPDNQALTLSVSGLPAGLSFNGTTITGTPSATGVSTITVVATDPGSLSVSTIFTLTVLPASVTVVTPPTGGPLALIAPIYDCSTGAITFQTTGGDGSTIEYFAIGITSWSTNPNQVIENGLRKDPSPITLHARQNGVEVTYVFDLPNACNTPVVNHAPVVSNTISSQTATVGQGYSFAIPAGTFTDPDNQALTLTTSGLPAGLSFSGSTITGTPSATGVSSVTVVATDPGSLSVSTSFTLTVIPTSVTVVTPPTGGPLVLIAPVYDCSTGAITFQTTGGDGSTIEYFAIGITPWTSNPNQHIESGLRADPSAVTLHARQSGTEVTYVFDLPNACKSGRVMAEPTVPLSVKVLGNPVTNDRLQVEVRGALGESLYLQVVGEQGLLIHELRLESATSVEQLEFEFGHPAGLYVLKVSTPTQQRVVKIIKQ